MTTFHQYDALFSKSELIDKTDEKGKPKNFMVSVGFKLPHLAVHVPYKYYEMYRNRTGSSKFASSRS